MTFAIQRVQAGAAQGNFIAYLDSVILTHPAWSKVDTVVSGAITATVYKCAGAQNGVGDFYVVVYVGAPATQPNLWFAVGEGYDATAKALSRPAPAITASDAPQADGSFYGGVNTYPLFTASAVVNAALLTAPNQFWTAAAANQPVDVALSVTNGFLLIALTNVGAPAVFLTTYLGLLESFNPSAVDPFPLVNVAFGTGSGGSNVNVSGMTRHPLVTAPGTYNWRGYLGSATQFLPAWTLGSGGVGSGDRLHNSRPVTSRMLFTHDLAGSAQQYGRLRGLYRELLVMLNTTTLGLGDTLTVNGAEHRVAALPQTGGGASGHALLLPSAAA